MMFVRCLFYLMVLTVSAAPLVGSTSTARAEAPAGAAANDPAARSAFEAGRDAYERGQFVEALEHFQRAYTLSQRPQLLFNIGRAADSDGQSERAIDAYERYLAAFPAAENRAFVEARLAKMRESVAAQAAPVPAASPAAPAATPVALPTVAEAQPQPLTSGAPAALPRDGGDGPRPVWKRAWFWSVIGVAVVAAGITAGVLGARDRDPDRASGDWYVVVGDGT